MYKDEKILAIIPARGGSKGLPGKNISMLMRYLSLPTVRRLLMLQSNME